MASATVRTEALLRERAFLALLLLVGAGAVGVGLLQVYRSNATSIPSVFDLALGASVLLVTWLFLAPSAVPEFFHDPAPGALPIERPYLGPVAPPAPVEAPRPRPSHRVESAIPRWADPLVAPRASVAAAARISAAPPVASVTRPATPGPSPAPAAPRTPARTFPEPPSPPLRAPRWLDELHQPPRDEGGAEHPQTILEELDRIEAELRVFVPLESKANHPEAGVFEDAAD